MITPSDIAIALGRPAPEPDSTQWHQWALWIDDAHMLIQNRAEQLDIPINTIDQTKLDYVIREAVRAHALRPDDATQVTIHVDDGMTSKSYRSGRGRVTITDEWWELLGLTSASGAFSVDRVATTAHNPVREWLTATDTTW